MKRFLPLLLLAASSAVMAETGSYLVEVIVFRNLASVSEGSTTPELRSFEKYPDLLDSGAAVTADAIRNDLPDGMRISLRMDGQEVRANPWQDTGPFPGLFENGPALLAAAPQPVPAARFIRRPPVVKPVRVCEPSAVISQPEGRDTCSPRRGGVGSQQPAPGRSSRLTTAHGSHGRSRLRTPPQRSSRLSAATSALKARPRAA